MRNFSSRAEKWGYEDAIKGVIRWTPSSGWKENHKQLYDIGYKAGQEIRMINLLTGINDNEDG